ncbi:unnamed protein product, partial [Vitis vinifera]
MEEEEIYHLHYHHHNLNHNHVVHQFSSKPLQKGVVPSATAPATSVHELLECPVCTNYMYPPIHQCHNGHTLCSTYKTRVHNVRIFQPPTLGKSRNLC